jgi:rubrerythrin
MPAELTAVDVLNIAQKMEGNGADFYRQAAELRIKADEKATLLRLAAMEEDHKATFARMEKSLSPRPRADESNDEAFEQAGLYLNAILDSDNLEGSRFAHYVWNGSETLASVVLMSIDLEKETILYYAGMKDLFRREADRLAVDEIIAEEKEHLAVLVGEYRRLEKNGK